MRVVPRRSLRSRVICRHGKKCETDDEREDRYFRMNHVIVQIDKFLESMEKYDKAFGKGWTIDGL